MTPRARHVICTAVLAALAAVPAVAAAAPIISMQDDRVWQVANPASRVALMAKTGARAIRVDMRWDVVATRRPAAPTNPADPAYDWRRYDAIVKAAKAKGLQVIFTVWGTPAWAADRSVPPPTNPAFQPYAIRPARPADYGDFGAAAAARYAPQRVHRWEAWNEPNIPLFLRPQFARKGRRWVPASPATYSAMLKAFYAGVHKSDRRALVSGAVTAPAGDKCPFSCPDQADDRMTPQDFIKALGAKGLRPPMDAVSHHPYPLTTPRTTTPPGRTYVDLYNLGELQRVIDSTYLRGKPLWLTEFGFATRATREYPFHVTSGQQAQFVRDAVKRVRKNRRVAVFTWYFLQDSPVWASGLLDQRGRPKPAYAVFRSLARRT